MDTQRLVATARALVSDDRGLLAMDESTPTCDKRFAKLGIATTEAMRRAYRDMIVTTSDLGRCISGAILYDETIRQTTLAGVPFAQALEQAGIVPGIKVDAGAKPLAGFADEVVTDGLDGLRERLAEYAGMGARFAKWRAVLRIGPAIPSSGCIEANAHALARSAALCQEAGLVPIVEPEVRMDGGHTLERCREVTEATLHVVFGQLHAQRVLLEGMLLEPNMVLAGAAPLARAALRPSPMRPLLPARRPGRRPRHRLSVRRPALELASAHLNAMNVRFRGRMPWALAFSFARAIQQPALEIWHGDAANVGAAQQALLHRAECNRAARRGEYDPVTDAPRAA